MANEDIKFICITPVRNEAWIISSFLEVNSQWADLFIVIDQSSTDGTTEILMRHPKVCLIKNENLEFDEIYRGKMLWDAVRKIKAKKKIVFALDADELLHITNCEEWANIKQLEKGTEIKLDWINVLPDSTYWWKVPKPFSFGYVDDGKEIAWKKIHNRRVPSSENKTEYICKDMVNLHLQYLPKNRNRKKQRWYQVWEKRNSNLSAIDIYRNYNKALNIPQKERIPIKKSWENLFVNYKISDLDFYTNTWWDEEIIQNFKENGTEFYKKLDIWDIEWNMLSIKNNVAINDPRAVRDKFINAYLKKSQPYRYHLFIRAIDKIIKQVW